MAVRLIKNSSYGCVASGVGSCVVDDVLTTTNSDADDDGAVEPTKWRNLGGFIFTFSIVSTH